MTDLTRFHGMMRSAVRGLAVGNVILTLIFVLMLGFMWYGPAANDAMDPEQQIAFAEPGLRTQITMDQVEHITRGKALFRTSRTRKAKVVDEFSHFRLSGISTRGGVPKAYVRDTKFKKNLIKRVGDMLGPYEIVGITDEGITVRRGAEEILLPKG